MIEGNRVVLAGFQLSDDGLTSLAALEHEADGFVKAVGGGGDTYEFRTMAEVKTDLSLVLGTDVQAYHANLASAAALSYSAASFVKMTGTDTFALRTLQETSDDLEPTIDHDNLLNFTADEHYLQSAITEVGTIATGIWQGTDVGIAYGGTGQSTAQAAINALTAVAGATNEYVLTKDTATGNAIWKVAAGVLSAYSTVDSDENAFERNHAYLATSDGYVSAHVLSLDAEEFLTLYVGLTDDPAGAGDIIQQAEGVNNTNCAVGGLVAAGEYFEITSAKVNNNIRWKSFGPLSAPVDQD